MMKKNNNPFTNSILESVYKYYTNEKNYLTESLEEDSGAIMLDDNLFNDIMSWVSSDTFDESDAESGHFLIPTKDNSTFHIDMNGDTYMTDNWGNEMEVNASNEQKNAILKAIMNKLRQSSYKNVSEGKDETDMYNIDNNTKPDTASFAAKGQGYKK